MYSVYSYIREHVHIIKRLHFNSGRKNDVYLAASKTWDFKNIEYCSTLILLQHTASYCSLITFKTPVNTSQVYHRISDVTLPKTGSAHIRNKCLVTDPFPLAVPVKGLNKTQQLSNNLEALKIQYFRSSGASSPGLLAPEDTNITLHQYVCGEGERAE